MKQNKKEIHFNHRQSSFACAPDRPHWLQMLLGLMVVAEEAVEMPAETAEDQSHRSQNHRPASEQQMQRVPMALLLLLVLVLLLLVELMQPTEVLAALGQPTDGTVCPAVVVQVGGQGLGTVPCAVLLQRLLPLTGMGQSTVVRTQFTELGFGADHLPVQQLNLAAQRHRLGLECL
eukprot:m.269213 g.269213  ORF g.269213 m.269213 type:complete len:176 (+) comp22820_c6_seq1:3124-3651(+)